MNRLSYALQNNSPHTSALLVSVYWADIVELELRGIALALQCRTHKLETVSLREYVESRRSFPVTWGLTATCIRRLCIVSYDTPVAVALGTQVLPKCGT